MMAQVGSSLSTTWEVKIEFQMPGCGLAKAPVCRWHHGNKQADARNLTVSRFLMIFQRKKEVFKF